MKNLTITNLENVLQLNVNMYEIENSIINGEHSYSDIDYTFFFMFLPTNKPNNYKTLNNEIILNTKEGINILIKKL